MKRKKYSKNNDLHIRLTDKQYKKVYDLSNQIGCSKVDVIRYLLSNPSTTINQHNLNVLKRLDNKLTDMLNRYYMNLYRLGSNLNQAVHNQNLALKRGHYVPLNADLSKIGKSINHLNLLMNKFLLHGGVSHGN